MGEGQATVITHGGRLPAETSRFFGRSKEAAAIRAVLPSSRLVTLTGPGGVGKTRLALRVADELAGEFPDGVRLVQLSAVRDACGLLHAVTAALSPGAGTGASGLSGPSGLSGASGAPGTFAEQAGRLANGLRGRRQLLILDTCEHLVDACAALVDSVLSGADGPVVLATSRQPLDLPGEVVFRVPPLTVPPDTGPRGTVPGGTAPGSISPGGAAGPDGTGPGADLADDGGDAVALFADRARAALPGFAMTDDARPKVAWLCRLLDGIPLEIELAALRLRAVGLDELLTRLPGRLRSLGGGCRADDRQRTVQASITWSYDLCTPAGRLLWTRLSVFSGGFSLAAAEAVCGGGDLPAADVLETLIGLVDQSIVLRADVTDSTDPDPDATDADENGLGTGRGSTRYRLLEVVREQGADRADAADATACGARHRDYYRGVARGFAASFGASFDGSGQAGRISRLAPDAANLRLALERSLASGPHVAGQHDAGQRDAGQPAVEQDILRCALAALAGTAPARPASGSEPEVTGATDRWVLLTAREREVAALVATGLTNKSIAMRLFVSKRTIDAHVEHILAKLRCASRVQIAAFVAQGRVVGEESETGMEASRIPDPRESQEHVSAPPGVSGTSVG